MHFIITFAQSRSALPYKYSASKSMFTNPFILRAQQLVDQNRLAEAEKLLKKIISEDGDDIHALSILAMVKGLQKDFAEAEKLIQYCLGTAPEDNYLLLTQSHLLLMAGKYAQAEQIALQLLCAEPQDADHHSLLGQIYLAQKQGEKALKQFNISLEIDPKDTITLNFRSLALTHLGRNEESNSSISSALVQDPENSFSHCIRGVNYLKEGRASKALEHFRNALRDDPDSEEAKVGIVSALQSKHLGYRLYLQYRYGYGRLSRKTKVRIALVTLVLTLIALIFWLWVPTYAIIGKIVLIIYGIYLHLTLITQPFFDLLLRSHKVGKLALSPRRIEASNYFGIALLFGIVTATIFFITQNALWGNAALVAVGMLGPLGTMNIPKNRENQARLTYFAFTLLAIGALGILYGILKGETFNPVAISFFFGLFFYRNAAQKVSKRERQPE